MKVQFEWKILDFTFFIKNFMEQEDTLNITASPVFSASADTDGHLWQLKMKLMDAASQQYGIFLSLMDNPFKGKVSVKFCFEFADSRNEVFLRSVSKLFRKFGKDLSWGWKTSVTYDTICKHSFNFTAEIKLLCNIEFEDSQTFNSNSLENYHSPTFGVNLFDQYKKQKHTDVTIKCENKEFKVHKLIFRAASPVFEELFEIKEDESLTIEDVSPELFEVFVRFLYTGKASINYKNAKDLLELGVKYAVTDLQEICLMEIGKNIIDSTAVDILIIADKHKQTALKENVLKYIKLNITAVLQSRAWKDSLVQRGDLLDSIIRHISVKNN